MLVYKIWNFQYWNSIIAKLNKNQENQYQNYINYDV